MPQREIKTEETTKPQILGRYIVADPEICHGKLTFRGTRIFVSDVLEMVASGLAWETIIEEWHGNITYEAIAEAVTLATKALFDHAGEYVLEPIAAQQEILAGLTHIRETIYRTHGVYQGDLVAEVRKERSQQLDSTLDLDVA